MLFFPFIFFTVVFNVYLFSLMFIIINLFILLRKCTNVYLCICFVAFGEAFITTFRTFITPLDLIEKLTHRYSILCCQMSEIKQKAAKESFSLLVRVVNDLT